MHSYILGLAAKGPAAQAHILRHLGESPVLGTMSSKQLAACLLAANAAWEDAQAVHKDACMAGDALWVGLGINQLIPVAALRSLRVEQAAAPAAYYTKGTRYALDYTEGHW